jgi:anti-sigma regulatory factor (Ser/Thr protein kinase)
MEGMMVRQALIVEEDVAPSGVLRRALEGLGLACVNQHPTAAAPWARAHRPAVAVLGAFTPGPDGSDLGEALQLDPATWDVGVLRLTTRRKHVDPCRGVEVEADEYLTPPWAEDAARRAAEAALRRAARRRARAEVRLRLRSELGHLERLNELMQRVLARGDLGPKQVQQLTLAVRELAANAIEWGHRNQPDRLVSVVCRLARERVTVSVRDTGPGFDRGNLPHAARPDDPLGHLPVRAARNLREGGFGILLASGLADELRYNAAGNEAQVVKYCAPPAGRARPALAASR